MMRRRGFLAGVAGSALPALAVGCAAPGAARQAVRAGAPEVRLDPGSDFNAMVAGAPPGARLILAPGTYRGWSAQPKDGQRFEAGGDGVVLDGGGQRLLAFHGAAEDVQLAGLTVQAYQPMDPPDGRGQAEQRAALEVTDGRNWQLVDVTVQRIAGRGVSLHPGMHILRGRYVDNGHVGIAGRGAEAVVEGAELARNNSAQYGSHWESGAYKNVGGSFAGQLPVMRGARLVNCHIHHNHGRAVWFDWDCLDGVLEGCVIHHNSNEGIAYEASAGGVFRNCLIGLNKTSGYGETGVWGAEVMLQNSHDCVVEGCTIVAASGCALAVAHHTRDSASDPPQQTGFYTGDFNGMDNRITGNTFVLLPDTVGLVLDANAPPGRGPVLASNTWGPNRWLVPLGASARPLWLDEPWRDALGTIEEVADPERFVPAELRA